MGSGYIFTDSKTTKNGELYNNIYFTFQFSSISSGNWNWNLDFRPLELEFPARSDGGQHIPATIWEPGAFLPNILLTEIF